MSDGDAKEMFYAMALNGLLPGVAEKITKTDKFRAIARRGAELLAMVQAADAEVDAVQAKSTAEAEAVLDEAHAAAKAILHQGSERVDAVQKRLRQGFSEFALEVREFFTQHHLEVLLDLKKPLAIAAAMPVTKPGAAHVPPQPAGDLKTE